MKRTYYSIFLLFAVLFVFTSCDKSEEAEKAANEFHELLEEGDKNGMLEMIHADAWKADSADYKAVMGVMVNLGEVKKIEKKNGPEKTSSEGEPAILFDYIIHFGAKKMEEQIVFQESEDGSMKIIRLQLR